MPSVLVADDELMRRLLQELTKEGYEIETVESGQEYLGTLNLFKCGFYWSPAFLMLF